MNIRLIKDLDFAAKLNAAEPMTESAQDVVKRYRGYLYTNPCSCALVNNFIREARQYGYDKGMAKILESVASFVAENKISWKLASACESISNDNSTYSYIAKIGIGKVEQLLEMNENDVVAYIKAGALKNVKYIPEFREICKDVYRSTINESETTVKYEMSTPFSYRHVTESGENVISILGKAYSISESKVAAVDCNDEKFVRINAHLSQFTQANESIEYKFGEYKFSINEGKLTLTKGDKQLEVFESSTDFLKYCDQLSRVMPFNQRQFMVISGAVAEVLEAYDDILSIDCARVYKNTNGTVSAIIEAKDNVIAIANGEVVDAPFMVEALDAVKKNCGVDLKVVYESRINEDVKKGNPEEYAAIQEELQRSKDAQAEIRYQKIERLAEAYKDDPATIAVLNRLSKELRILEEGSEA